MLRDLDAGFLNPSSQHRPGQLARRQLEQYRTKIIDHLGGESRGMATDRLVFTSGGTESDNLAIFGLASWGRQRLVEQNLISKTASCQVLFSAVEHPAVAETRNRLAQLGFRVREIPVDENGIIRLDELKQRLLEPTALVSIMLANNETGVLQPVQEAAELCRQQSVLVHSDAVQVAGKLPLRFRELGLDALSVTAHKVGGPRGIGGLLLRSGISPEPMLFGGFQQLGTRPGTEDVLLAGGLATALESWSSSGRAADLEKLRDWLQGELLARFPNSFVHGAAVERTPQTLNISFPWIDRQSFLMAADLAGLAVSAGSACASGSSEPSPVLLAMGVEKSLVNSAIRFSLGHTNTVDEISETLARLESILRR